MKKIILAIFCIMSLSETASAGVKLSANRLVYDGQKSDASLTLKNEDSRPFLIQSWLEAKGNPLLEGKKLPFMVTPPLFKMDAGAENVIQIVALNNDLPQDRESLMWLNIKAIPSTKEEEKKISSKLLLAIDNRIKVFYRPAGLKGDNVTSTASLKWSKQDLTTLSATNDSPFYIVINKLTVNGQAFPVSIDTNNTVIPPFAKKSFNVKSSLKGHVAVTWSSMNDFSIPTKEFSAEIN